MKTKYSEFVKYVSLLTNYRLLNYNGVLYRQPKKNYAKKRKGNNVNIKTFFFTILEKIPGPLGRASQSTSPAHSRKRKVTAISDHGTKGHIATIAKAGEGFLNCYLIKKGYQTRL